MKKIFLVALALVIALAMTGCSIGNNAQFDFKYTFHEAQISMPDGTVVSGQIQSWNDYEDSDVIQLKIDNIVYLTHYSNVVMIRYE